MIRAALRSTIAAAMFVSLAACSSSSGGGEPLTARAWGAILFQDPTLSDSRTNRSSCGTCHAVTEAQPAARIDPGYTMWGVTRRERYFGGNVVRLIDAASECLVSFMGASRGLDRDDGRSKALYEYLASLGGEGAALPTSPLTVVEDVADVARADAQRGAVVWAAACARCHGELHTGAGRLIDTAPILPEAFATYGTAFPRATVAEVVIEKVRHGRYFGLGGVMPLYSKEALSDEDLGALLAHLGL